MLILKNYQMKNVLVKIFFDLNKHYYLPDTDDDADDSV